MVFAHQDDDLLWMFPFWDAADKFILAAMPSTDFHDEVVRQHSSKYQMNWVPAFGKLTFLKIQLAAKYQPALAPMLRHHSFPSLATIREYHSVLLDIVAPYSV
jgi:hypothetical protein